MSSLNSIKKVLLRPFSLMSLRGKLVGVNLLILLLAILAFGLTAYRGLNILSARFSALNLERSNSVKNSYREISSQNVNKIRAIYEQNFRNKGQALLSKDSSSLAPMIADNSFSGVRQFLQKNFEDDKDITLATYFTVDNLEIRAWNYISSEYKNGLSFPMNYDREKKGWMAKTTKGRSVFIPDPAILEAVKLDKPEVKFRAHEMNRQKLFGFDCTIPFVEGKTGQAVRNARKKGEPVGFLRYILSPNEMNSAIEAEQKKFENRLKSLETENQAAFIQSQSIGHQATYEIFKILAVVACLIIIFGCIAVFISATQISNPVKFLTRIVGSMTQGNYSQKIRIHSNDEIGVLAAAFQKMSDAIQKRDVELADINRNLEKTIELRTSQLKDENRKISGLLNNMKQAVFAVSSDYRVIAPVSKYSDSVFNEEVYGKSIFNFLYKGLDPNSEEMANLNFALTSVFGESDVQWDLMEDLFPKQVKLKHVRGADGKDLESSEQILRISYSPLYDEHDLVSQIMMVVEDITKVEKLMSEVQHQHKKAAILQQLTEHDPAAIKGFFSSAGSMLSEMTKMLNSQHSTVESLGVILRHLHTIKGNSRTLNLEISKTVHTVESEVEGILKELKNSGLTTVPVLNLGDIKEVIGKVKNQLDEYRSVATLVYGLKEDLPVRTYYRFHKGITDLSWSINQSAGVDVNLGSDVELNKNLLDLIADSHELKWPELEKQLQHLTAVAGSNSTRDGSREKWKSAILESAYSVVNSSLFSEHLDLPYTWVGLGIKLWNLSEGLKQVRLETFKDSDLVSVYAQLEDAWSFCSSHNLLFYAGYLRRMESFLRKSEFKRVEKIESSIWNQYLLAARSHVTHKLKSNDQESLNKILLEVVQNEKHKSADFNSINSYNLWLVSLVNGLERNRISVNSFFSRWADRVGSSVKDLIKTLTSKDPSWSDHATDTLSAVLDQTVQSSPDSIGNMSRDHFSLFKEDENPYLKLLDICQLFSGLIDDPESAKGRYKMVEVLSINVDLMKEAILRYFITEDVSERGQRLITSSMNKLLDVPVKPVLWNYRRMVGLLAQQLNKKIEFSVKGDEITLPRDVLYVFQDAMVHLVRNSIDHGIEEPAERKKANKPEAGLLSIDCELNDQWVIIRLKDDGSGIDVGKVLANALRRGLISPKDAAGLSNEQKLDLIFIAGFSSKNEVTELSGRGIGMEVVKKNIESLGGKLFVRTQSQIGTVFEVHLPVLL